VRQLDLPVNGHRPDRLERKLRCARSGSGAGYARLGHQRFFCLLWVLAGNVPAMATDVPRQVVAGGGRHSSGGVFAVHGTIGQADADPLQPSTGGTFAVTGGFWAGVGPTASGPPDPSCDGNANCVFRDGFEPAMP